MYNELVKRLRNAAYWADKGLLIAPSLCLEAANVIEELSREYESISESLNESVELVRKRFKAT